MLGQTPSSVDLSRNDRHTAVFAFPIDHVYAIEGDAVSVVPRYLPMGAAPSEQASAVLPVFGDDLVGAEDDPPV